MGVFKDDEHLYECIGGLFDILGQDETIGKKLQASKLILRFSYSDPDSTITVNCQDPPTKEGYFIEWFRGPNDLKPVVEMSMKSDVAHKFGLGKVNLLAAITRRQIVAKGPIPKVLKLLPIIKPAYGIYKDLLQKKGYTEMLQI